MNLVYRKAHLQASYPLMTWPSLQGAFWCVLHPTQQSADCDDFAPQVIKRGSNLTRRQLTVRWHMRDTLQNILTSMTERIDALQARLSVEKDKVIQRIILADISKLARRRSQLIAESGVI